MDFIRLLGRENYILNYNDVFVSCQQLELYGLRALWRMLGCSHGGRQWDGAGMRVGREGESRAAKSAHMPSIPHVPPLTMAPRSPVCFPADREN